MRDGALRPKGEVGGRWNALRVGVFFRCGGAVILGIYSTAGAATFRIVHC